MRFLIIAMVMLSASCSVVNETVYNTVPQYMITAKIGSLSGYVEYSNCYGVLQEYSADHIYKNSFYLGSHNASYKKISTTTANGYVTGSGVKTYSVTNEEIVMGLESGELEILTDFEVWERSDGEFQEITDLNGFTQLFKFTPSEAYLYQSARIGGTGVFEDASEYLDSYYYIVKSSGSSLEMISVSPYYDNEGNFLYYIAYGGISEGIWTYKLK